MKIMDVLKGISLFEELDSKELKILGKIAEERTYAPGSTIFCEGDKGDSLFSISYGKVKVLVEMEEVTRLVAGSHFGEIAIIDSLPRSATVEAIERTEVVEIKHLERLLQTNDRMACKLYKAFAKSLARDLRRSSIDLRFMRELATRQFLVI